MTGKVVWPSLGPEGFISDNTRLLNTSFAHTLTSDALQSSIYNGNITSMTDIIVRNQNNPVDLVDALESAYTKFYNRIFDVANVNASFTNNPDSSYSINLSIVVEKDGVEYSLAYTGALDNSSLSNVLKGMAG